MRVSVTLTPVLKDALKNEARLASVSEAEIVRRAIEAHFGITRHDDSVGVVTHPCLRDEEGNLTRYLIPKRLVETWEERIEGGDMIPVIEELRKTLDIGLKAAKLLVEQYIEANGIERGFRVHSYPGLPVLPQSIMSKFRAHTWVSPEERAEIIQAMVETGLTPKDAEGLFDHLFYRFAMRMEGVP